MVWLWVWARAVPRCPDGLWHWSSSTDTGRVALILECGFFNNVQARPVVSYFDIERLSLVRRPKFLQCPTMFRLGLHYAEAPRVLFLSALGTNHRHLLCGRHTPLH